MYLSALSAPIRNVRNAHVGGQAMLIQEQLHGSLAIIFVAMGADDDARYGQVLPNVIFF